MEGFSKEEIEELEKSIASLSKEESVHDESDEEIASPGSSPASLSEMKSKGYDPDAVYYDLKGNIVYQPKGSRILVTL